jgi:hypothetical protein
VTNWTFFDGALAAIVMRDAAGTTAMRTAVMIAPGLAVTAAHVLGPLEDIIAGNVALLMVSPRQGGLDLWRVHKLSAAPDSDVAYVSVSLASPIDAEWQLTTIPVTTRMPELGESVHLVGLRFLAPAIDNTDRVSLRGELHAARGEVVATHHPIRDPVLMPFPTIEVSCGSLGGMSGGAVLDDDGFLLGVTSRGFDAPDGLGPTFAAWTVGALNRAVELPWPPGLYASPIHLLDVDQRLLNLDGRDKVAVEGETTVRYEVWFRR